MLSDTVYSAARRAGLKPGRGELSMWTGPAGHLDSRGEGPDWPAPREAQTVNGFCFRKVATGPIVNRFGVWIAGMPALMCAWKVA